jgi:hypothetical protein
MGDAMSVLEEIGQRLERVRELLNDCDHEVLHQVINDQRDWIVAIQAEVEMIVEDLRDFAHRVDIPSVDRKQGVIGTVSILRDDLRYVVNNPRPASRMRGLLDVLFDELEYVQRCAGVAIGGKRKHS